MSLAAPRLLWLALVVPLLVVAYAIDGQRRRRVLEHIGHQPMIAQMIASLSAGRRRLQVFLTVATAGLLALALGRPQVAGRARLTESRGLDLVIALDLSRSMLARDVYPSRLERAKAEVARLLDELKGDRVGLVAFAGETLAYPLTSDYEAAKLFWRDLSPADMPVGGTDLGRAINAATELLDRAAERAPPGRRRPGQVLLLITDGEDTEGRGLEAARVAAAHDIHIYAIAIGSKDRPFVPIGEADGKAASYVSGDDGEPVRVGVDEEGLRRIAAISNGEYFTIEPRRFGVERVQQAIAALERTEEEARLEREPEDVGRWVILGAFVLLAFGAALGDRRRRAKTAPLVPPAPPPTREPTGRVPAAPALVLLLAFPMLSGFDLFMRTDPDVEAGNKALAEGRAQEALGAYDRAAAARPDDPTVRFDRGAALLQLERLPEATRELQRAVETRDPSLKADAYYNLGVAQHKQGHFKEAVEAYKRALGLRPDDRRTKWNLEVAQRRLKEQKEQPQQKDPQQKDQKDPRQKDPQQKDPQQKDPQQKDPQQKDQKDPQQAQLSDGGGPRDLGAERAEPQQTKNERTQDLERQDAEAVLDSLERVEPTVQKDLARRRAGGRKAKKDW